MDLSYAKSNNWIIIAYSAWQQLSKASDRVKSFPTPATWGPLTRESRIKSKTSDMQKSVLCHWPESSLEKDEWYWEAIIVKQNL